MKPAEFANLFRVCQEDREWAIANCATMDDAWATARPDWLVWIATRTGILDDHTLRRFTVWSARQIKHLMPDPRSVTALDVAERYADRKATDKELAAARNAARDAAWTADAAYTVWAALEAAWAARYAARYAGYAARYAAWGAAVTAAWVTTWDAQAAWLRSNATPDWERARKMGGAR